jgi:hypothetical protein
MKPSRLPLLPSSVAIAEGSLAQAAPTMSMAGSGDRSSLRPVGGTGSSRPLTWWQPVLRSTSDSDGREQRAAPCSRIPEQERSVSDLHTKFRHELSKNH